MADIPSDVLALSDSEDDQSHSSRGDKVTKKRSTTRKSVTRKPTSGRKRKSGESLSNQDKRVRNDEVPSTEDTPLMSKDIPTIVKAVLDSLPGSSTTNSDGIHPEESPGTLVICMCVLVCYIYFSKYTVGRPVSLSNYNMVWLLLLARGRFVRQWSRSFMSDQTIQQHHKKVLYKSFCIGRFIWYKGYCFFQC